MLLFFLLAICFSANSDLNKEQKNDDSISLSANKENKPKIFVETEEDQSVQDLEFLRKTEVVILFNGWSPKGDNHRSLKILEEVFAKNTPEILDYSNRYLDIKDKPMPVFDSESVADEIFQKIVDGKKIWLVGYSEGSIGLLESIMRVVNRCKKQDLLEELKNLIRISVIDPPSKKFFDFKLESIDFWFINLTADCVKWIAGITSTSKFSERRFPGFSDAFLNGFKFLWKNIIIPISYKRRRGEERMFYRAAFVKDRAVGLQKQIADLEKGDADLIKTISTVYLQNWREKEEFAKIAIIKKLNYTHDKIRKAIIAQIKEMINI